MDKQLLKDIQEKGKKIMNRHRQRHWRKMNPKKVGEYNKKSNKRRGERIKDCLFKSMQKERLFSPLIVNEKMELILLASLVL